ncbi:hypothetical protein DYB28_004837 [Aphanomyces astaci]|uniref:Apple domain-containing protein n=1 Tax=Aphanomyces astaci TaxID=112090 RepID=A0A9X8HFE8_APHAT|nr:hypothetical protein DYB28_004837 [Aphanomyces astaci]
MLQLLAVVWWCAVASSVAIDDLYEVVPDFTGGFGCDGPLQNLDFFGNDLFQFKGDGDACKKACNDTPACGAFTLAYGQCFIKSDVGSKVSSTRGCKSYICYRQR